jgi:hypothetical protein
VGVALGSFVILVVVDFAGPIALDAPLKPRALAVVAFLAVTRDALDFASSLANLAFHA